jgi:hypothetical protein
MMNEVDYLLKYKFSTLTFEDKLEVKRLGAHQPSDLVIVNELVKPKKKLTFKSEWFTKKTWLTASVSLKRLFCFPCLIFGGETVWAQSGYSDLKHLSERLTSHETSSSHMKNAVTLKLFGKSNIVEKLDSVYRRNIQRHNQEVDKNRYVLSKIISVLRLCGSCEIGIRGRDETSESLKPGVFRSVFQLLCEDDVILKNYYENSPSFKGTSKTIQNELLDCMYDLYRELLKEEISTTNFVSIQADETTDVSCKAQLVIILRYITKLGTVTERFVQYSKLVDKSASGLTAEIKSVLSECGINREKLIAQTYDGAAVMKGNLNGVQAQIKVDFPYAHFVHCYAHQLNLVMQQLCSKTHKELKIFFGNISGFSSFFSVSTKRTCLLDNVVNQRMPRPSATRWNFSGRMINTVYENLNEMRECFLKFQEDPGWDAVTLSEACGLLNLLYDRLFCCLLSFFAQVMPEVDILFQKLQKVSIDNISANLAITHFKAAILKIREKTDELGDLYADLTCKRNFSASDLKRVMKEACDVIVVHVSDRFSNTDHLTAARLVDVRFFKDFSKKFPDKDFDIAVKYYPFLLKNKLRTELQILYGHDELTSDVKSAASLLASLDENNVKEIFTEVTKLLEIIITIPMTTSESERCFSTLKRIKTSSRNTIGEERLNALSMLSIEDEFIKSVPDFNNKVIDRFAKLKNRRVEFNYKTLSDTGGI